MHERSFPNIIISAATLLNDIMYARKDRTPRKKKKTKPFDGRNGFAGCALFCESTPREKERSRSRLLSASTAFCSVIADPSCLLEDAPFAITNAATTAAAAKTKPKADLLSSEKSPAAHVRRPVERPFVAASGTSSGMPAASSDWGLKASLATGSGSLRASPGMWSYAVKLDEEKSKHVGLAQEIGFGSA